MTEDEAIQQLKRGDIRGLQALVERYEHRAVHAAHLITLDWAAAEDIVQDAFVRVYQRIAQFDASREFGPWFLRGVVNDAIKWSSRQKSVSLNDSSNEYPDFAVNDPAELVEGAETREAIWRALAQLPPNQRAAVVLRYYLDLNESEIARELDCAPGTVKWRLHVARRQLAILLRWMKT